MNIKVDFDEAELKRKLLDKNSRAQKKLDAQVLKDSNFYIPKETSSLEKSSIISSKIGSGRLVWKTPYAIAQYYGVNFDHSKSRNPNARALWFEEAKAVKIELWRKIVNDEYHKNS